MGPSPAYQDAVVARHVPWIVARQLLQGQEAKGVGAVVCCHKDDLTARYNNSSNNNSSNNSSNNISSNIGQQSQRTVRRADWPNRPFHQS